MSELAVQQHVIAVARKSRMHSCLQDTLLLIPPLSAYPLELERKI